MKKKIVYIWKSPYPWDVRVEKICKSLSKEYEVLILARWNGEAKKAELIDGITIKRVGFGEKSYKSTPLSFNPIWKKELRKVVAGYKPDMIIVREIMLGTLAGKVAKENNIPVVMDMAENYPAVIKLFKKYKQKFISRFLIHTLDLARTVEKRSLKFIKNIIVVCKEQKQRLQNESFYDNHNIVIVENTPPYDSESKLEKNFQYPIFGHHGNLTADKSIFQFLKAVIELLDDGEKLEFHIMGKGEIYDETKKLIDNSAHTDKIKMYGNWNKDRFIEYMRNINIGVLPYEVNDFTNTTNFNKYFDFLKYGIPVLTSNTGPMNRVDNEYNCGISTDVSSVDEIKKSIMKINVSNFTEYSNNAFKAYNEKYNWDIDEKNLLNYISELI
jgi:glycosyltransferase involved in cell wall biosynthesis